MKTIKFLALMAVAAMLASCSNSRNMSQQPAYNQPQANNATAMQNELNQMQLQMQMDDLKHQMEMEKMKREAERKSLETQLSVQESMVPGTQAILVFCMDDAIDKTGEYMAGLGISEDQRDQKDALLSANQIALQDIITRFLGVIKNGAEFYNQETNNQRGDKIKESQLEGLALTVGEKAINKYSNVVCRKIVSKNNGHGVLVYGAYVAVHVPLKEVIDEVSNNLSVQGVVRDKNAFRNGMLKQLEADQEKAIREQERLIEQYNSLNR